MSQSVLHPVQFKDMGSFQRVHASDLGQRAAGTYERGSGKQVPVMSIGALNALHDSDLGSRIFGGEE